MTRKTLMHLLLLLAVAAAGLSQSEDQPYFSLRSGRTFASGGAPSVTLSASNVDKLDFRVYRINDPLQFFEQLQDSHEFGGHAPRPPHAMTLLEVIHDWKAGLRARIRSDVRRQFTESPRDHFTNLLHKRQPATGGQAHYPQSSVLNPQQLVLSFPHTVANHDRWASETIPLDLKQRGVYLVEAVNQELRAYTIVMVSDIVLTTKRAPSGITAMVVNRNSGEPVRGAQVYSILRDDRIGSVETDGDGIAEVKAPKQATDDLRVVVRSEAGYAVNTLSIENEHDEWEGYVYTDRPVYRPGHTVHFRGILRVRTLTGYDVPAGKSLLVEVQDPEQKPVYRKTLTANPNGVVHDELTLPAGAALGDYYISIRAGEDANMGGSFEVQEYKKPEYEVRVTADQPRILEGDPAHATIDARYYFGEPVAGAVVKYAVYRSRYWFPLWYVADDDSADMGMGDAGDEPDGDQILEQEGKLDADGKLAISFATKLSDHKYDYRYRVEARVTDEARREIVGHGSVIATYGSFLVNVTPDRYLYKPGDSASFKVEARDYDNKPVQTRVHVEMFQWDWRDKTNGALKGSADVDTGADGSATATLQIPAAATYRVRVSAHTPEGREIEDVTSIWTPGGDFGEYGGESERKNITVLLDKKSYQPGDTAQVVFVTGKANTPVYVSVEGRDLRSRKLIHSQDTTVTYQVPITAQQEPGFFVSAQFVRAGAMYRGTKYIKVPAVDHQLNVAISTDKPQYQPGQTAQYTIAVTTPEGKPVPQADFSLGVVDEAIYAIRPDTVPDPLNYFFGHEWDRVSSDDSIDYYFSGEAGKRRMQLAQMRAPSRLAQLKPERLVQPKVRKAFPDTAFWAADLTTDTSGRAHAKVDFPDSLTTWRATARGATRDTKVGAGTTKTIVRKNLIVRLAVPRFFVQGDEVTISVLVHNYLTSPKMAHVSLDVKGLDVLDGATRDVEVLSRSEVRLDWRVRAQQVRSVTVTGKALTDEESDAVEMDLPVDVPGVKLSMPHGGTLTAGASAAYDFTYPAKVSPGSRSLAIEMSPSIAGSLFGAVEYLTSFPYGCVEQTMSSFLPNVIVTQAVKDLGLKANLDAVETQQKIRDGLDRLYTFQHDDGGWGWWQTDDSHPFMTAYVVAGLAQAQAAGVEIKPEVMNRGAEWVAKEFARDPKLAPDLRAYMQYALVIAGRPDANALAAVYAQRSQLSSYGVAVLGLAMEQVKDARAGDLAAALEQSVRQDQQQAWWPSTRDELLDFSTDATPESTAFAVKFLSHQKPASPLLPKAALWLMNHRDEGYWWTSTKQTAMVIYGLTDYLKLTNELKPNFTATVYVNDKPVATRTYTDATDIAAPPLTIDESKLAAGVNHVRVTTSGQGRLYYSTRADYYSTEDKLQKTGSASLNILRDYFKLVPQKDGDKIVYDTVALSGPVASGDVIAVRLTVSGSEWKYLLAEDPIPAGTEFIANDGSYELKNRPPWWEYFFTRREMHDDRMAIFETYFPQGQQQYFYLLKVVNPGNFQMSPARVQPMYQPSVLSTSETRRLEVK